MRTDRNIKSKITTISSSQSAAIDKPLSSGADSENKLSQANISRASRLVAACKQIPKNIRGIYMSVAMGIPYYIPGFFFFVMAAALIFAPSLFPSICAGLIIYLGFVALYLGRRFRVLQSRFAEVVKQVEARIYIRGQAPGWTEHESIDSQGPDKKTVMH